MSRRRWLLALSGLAIAARAFGQAPSKTYRVGVLLTTAGLAGRPYVDAIRERLAAQGFVEGRNLQLDIRFVGDRAAARGIGLEVPRSILLRADRVIE